MAVNPSSAFPAPPADDGAALARWLDVWSRHEAAGLITNARVESRGLSMRPLPGNATYVTSLWDQFGLYPVDEFKLLPPGQRQLARMLFVLARGAFPRHLLRRSWLHENPPVSTPLWTRPARELVPPVGSARRGLLEPAPVGCVGLPSRVVWLRPAGTAWTANNRKDERLERRSPGEWHALGPEDMETAAGLYRGLYLGKYSALNPDFTPTLLRELQRVGLVAFEGLFDQRSMLGVVGTCQVGDWLTTPVLGYDMSRPASEGLYRRLAHRIMGTADARRLHLHRSAGAGSFKSCRGAQPALEWIWIRPQRFSPGLHVLRCLAGLALREARRRGL